MSCQRLVQRPRRDIVNSLVRISHRASDSLTCQPDFSLSLRKWIGRQQSVTCCLTYFSSSVHRRMLSILPLPVWTFFLASVCIPKSIERGMRMSKYVVVLLPMISSWSLVDIYTRSFPDGARPSPRQLAPSDRFSACMTPIGTSSIAFVHAPSPRPGCDPAVHTGASLSDIACSQNLLSPHLLKSSSFLNSQSSILPQANKLAPPLSTASISASVQGVA